MEDSRKFFLTPLGFGILLDELKVHQAVAINGWLRQDQLDLIMKNSWFYRKYFLGGKQVSQVAKTLDSLLSQREVSGYTLCGPGGHRFDKSLQLGLVEEEES